MAITDRIVGITSASFAGSPVEGITEMGFTARKIRKSGRSGGEFGDTSKDTTYWEASGYVEFDNDAAGFSALCTGAVGILIVVGKRAGTATAVTITIGRLASSQTSGALFTDSGELSVSVDQSGNTPRVRVPFVAQFHSADTQLYNTSSNGLITVTAA